MSRARQTSRRRAHVVKHYIVCINSEYSLLCKLKKITVYAFLVFVIKQLAWCVYVIRDICVLYTNRVPCGSPYGALMGP